jgi:hypothetical protein
MRTKKDIQFLLEGGLSSSFLSKLNDSQTKSLVERFGRDKKITVIKNTELKNKVKDFIKTYSKIKDIENHIDDWSDEELANQIKGYAKHANSGGPNKTAGDLYKQIEKSLKDGKKEETKESVQTTQQSGYKTTVTPGTPANLNVDGTDISIDPSKGITMMSTSKPVGSGEVSEKFESQSQQNFFWAKCNTSKGVKKNKWCELAREFSDSTSKKQYKTMPKKKNPEKMDESYEKFLEDKIVGMIERRIEPKMTKGDILKTISEKMEKNNSMMLRNPKKMSMFSHESGIEGKRMKRPNQMMPIMGAMEENDTKEKERTKEKDSPTKPGTPPKRRGNPFKDPNPGVKESPRGEKKNKEKMKQDFIGLIKQVFQ